MVQTFSHRNVYDVPEKDDEGNEGAYQEDVSSEDHIVHQVEDVEDEVGHEDDMVDQEDEVVHVDARVVRDLEREVHKITWT